LRGQAEAGTCRKFFTGSSSTPLPVTGSTHRTTGGQAIEKKILLGDLMLGKTAITYGAIIEGDKLTKIPHPHRNEAEQIPPRRR
jgi:hypothetical protein